MVKCMTCGWTGTCAPDCSEREPHPTDEKRSPSALPEIDWRAELRAFRAHVQKPQPCPRPESCDNYSCDVNRVAIKAFERVDDLLAAKEGVPRMGQETPDVRRAALRLVAYYDGGLTLAGRHAVLVDELREALGLFVEGIGGTYMPAEDALRSGGAKDEPTANGMTADELLAEVHRWRHCVAYWLGDMADHATPGECRAEGLRRSREEGRSANPSPAPETATPPAWLANIAHCFFELSAWGEHVSCSDVEAERDAAYERDHKNLVGQLEEVWRAGHARGRLLADAKDSKNK